MSLNHVVYRNNNRSTERLNNTLELSEGFPGACDESFTEEEAGFKRESDLSNVLYPIRSGDVLDFLTLS